MPCTVSHLQTSRLKAELARQDSSSWLALNLILGITGPPHPQSPVAYWQQRLCQSVVAHLDPSYNGHRVLRALHLGQARLSCVYQLGSILREDREQRWLSSEHPPLSSKRHCGLVTASPCLRIRTHSALKEVMVLIAF